MITKPYGDIGHSFSAYIEGGKLHLSVKGAPPHHWDESVECEAGRWYHMAVVYEGVLEKPSFYLNGLSLSEHQAGKGGVPMDSHDWIVGRYDHDVGQYFSGRIDEILFHNVAKSADYVYHRANPGTPKVRFLGNTVVENQGTEQAPSYPVRTYKMYWGDENATAVMPFVSSLPDAPVVVPDSCFGLLSGCHGYAGWWRFNEGGGDVAVDSSTAKRNAEFVGSAFANGAESLAAHIASAEQTIVVPANPALTGFGQLTAEAQVKPTSWSDNEFDANVVFASEQDDPTLGSPDCFRLYLRNNEHRAFASPNGIKQVILTDTVPAASAWQHTALVHSGEELSLLVDHVQVGSGDLEGPLAAAETDFWIGGNNGPDNAYHFDGLIDSARVSNRALMHDEFLHFPMLRWAAPSGPCTPNCAGKACGDDGCGGSCGECGEGYECDEGSCEYTGEVWTDPATGLIWQVTYTGGQLAQADSVPHCEALSLAGHEDWRLPNITELRGLLRECPTSELGAADCNVEEGGCLESTCNEGAFCWGCLYGAGPDNGCYWPDELAGTCGDFWSTTAVTDQAQHAWGVRFYYASLHDGPASTPLFVRCVRDECAPDCAGKACGDDGCGGSCGVCGEGDTCWEHGCTPIECDDGNEVSWDGCTDGLITETRVDGGTAWTSGQATGTVLSSDAFAVAWQGQFPGDVNGIGVRIFASDGTPLMDPFLGNTTTVNQQWYPDLAAGANSEFLLAFSDNMLHAYSQVLNSAGGFPGSQLEITGAQEGTGDGLVLAIAIPGEQYLVTFGIKNEAQLRGLATVIVDGAGSQAGSPIVVVDTTNPAGTITLLGHFLFDGFVGILYDKSGTRYVRKLALPSQVLAAETPLAQFPFASFATNGTDTGYGIYAEGDPGQGQAEVLVQTFDSTLAPLGPATTLLSGSKYASLRLCYSPAGTLGIAWGNEWDGGTIGSAIVDSQLNLIGQPVQANVRQPGGLVLDDALCFSDGSTAVLWTQWKLDETSIWFQRFNADGTKAYPAQ